MFMDINGNYGALPIKDIEETCYRKAKSYNVAISRELISSNIFNIVSNKVKESIATSFQKYMKYQDRYDCLRAQSLVVSIVEAILATDPGSQDTVKVGSSQDKQNSNEMQILSGSTEKLTTDDDEEEEHDEEALIQRKRRRTDTECHSHSVHDVDTLGKCSNPSTGHIDNGTVKECSASNGFTTRINEEFDNITNKETDGM